MKFTILGSSGFIGSHLKQSFLNQDIECFTPTRYADELFNSHLGHVIYCVGLTSDFRVKLLDTVKAHVCYLIDILEKTKFESFLYLSSTRVYSGLESGYEYNMLCSNPNSSNDLYNISKMMGESTCLSIPNKNIRVIRISNVYGNDFSSTNFLTSIIKDAVISKKITLQTNINSEKDYIYIDDLIKLIPKIATCGKQRIYNIANGENTSHKQLIEFISQTVNYELELVNQEMTVKFPVINIDRIKQEFNFTPTSISKIIPSLIENYQKELVKNDKN